VVSGSGAAQRRRRALEDLDVDAGRAVVVADLRELLGASG
jgi:hypothetical protein